MLHISSPSSSHMSITLWVPDPSNAIGELQLPENFIHSFVIRNNSLHDLCILPWPVCWFSVVPIACGHFLAEALLSLELTTVTPHNWTKKKRIPKEALCCQPPSCKYRLIPMIPPESLTSCKHSCWPSFPMGSLQHVAQNLPSKSHPLHTPGCTKLTKW